MKTVKYRLYPTEAQKVLLDKHIGAARFIYNLALETKQMAYKGNQVSLSYFDLTKQLPELKEECGWLKEVSAQALQQSIANLETAFTNFFKGHAEFPKFKSKRRDNKSFRIPQRVILNFDKGKFFIPKFREGINIVLHRPIEGTIRQATISKTPTGKYFASILCETGEELPAKVPIKKDNTIGIDLGLKDFAITSNGIKYKNNRYTKKYAKKLKRAQQHLSRKTKGSNGFEKQRLKVARIYEKISNTRKDVLHKVSNDIVSNYDVICLEDLNVKGMIKNKRLSKHIADASWGTFVGLLQYKCDWYGKELVKVDRWYPSSKTCNVCEDVNKDLKLSDRDWTCGSCGVIHDRDVNASKNILKEGLKIISGGTLDNTDGDSSKTSVKKHKSVKSGSQSIASGVGR